MSVVKRSVDAFSSRLRIPQNLHYQVEALPANQSNAALALRHKMQMSGAAICLCLCGGGVEHFIFIHCLKSLFCCPRFVQIFLSMA